MARPALFKLIEEGALPLGLATQESGLLASVGLRLKATKLKERKEVLELVRVIAEGSVDEGFIGSYWEKEGDGEWTGISDLLLGGFDATDPTLQYECARALHSVVKLLIGGETREPDCPK